MKQLRRNGLRSRKRARGRMNPAHRRFVGGWAFGVAGLLAGAVGAGGLVAGALMVFGGTLLVWSGLLTLSGEAPVYRGTRLRPVLGWVMFLIGVLWVVFGVSARLNGW